MKELKRLRDEQTKKRNEGPLAEHCSRCRAVVARPRQMQITPVSEEVVMTGPFGAILPIVGPREHPGWRKQASCPCGVG